VPAAMRAEPIRAQAGITINVRFNGGQPANAWAKTPFEVITDYGNYPGFNPSVADVAVLRQDERILCGTGVTPFIKEAARRGRKPGPGPAA